MSELLVTVDGHELDVSWSDANPETRAAIPIALPLEGEEPRAASPVTVVATVDDVSPLAGLDGGAMVRVAER